MKKKQAISLFAWGLKNQRKKSALYTKAIKKRIDDELCFEKATFKKLISLGNKELKKLSKTMAVRNAYLLVYKYKKTKYGNLTLIHRIKLK